MILIDFVKNKYERRYILPTIAIIGFLWAIIYVSTSNKAVKIADPIGKPPSSAFAEYIAGAAIVEANTENISIGVPISGIVQEIFVNVGDWVKKGDPLFKIDDREFAANLAIARAEVAQNAAKAKEAEISFQDISNQYKLAQNVKDIRAISKEDLDRRKYAADAAGAKLEQAKADQQRAAAAFEKAQSDLERLTVRAPVDGEILQLNLRLGEFAGGSNTGNKIYLVMGGTSPLHARIDIDENDSWRFKEGAAAKAFLRGNSKFEIPLEYVKQEEYIIPKKSLTGESTERVDTRVLQVIYKFDKNDLPIFVGQQLDVFIEEKNE